MSSISSKIDIAAPPDEVWKVFTDHAQYPEWNPFITELFGGREVCDRLNVTIKLPTKSSGMSFTPTIKNYDKNTHLSWEGRLLGLPAVFTGVHHFKLHERKNGMTFEQSEYFSGILVIALNVVGSEMFKQTESGFELMDEALKKRVERVETRVARGLVGR